MHRILAALILSGCAPVYCDIDGMSLLDEPTSSVWGCGRLNYLSTKMHQLVPGPGINHGYGLHLVDSISFTDPWNRAVGGYTDCFSRTMYIGTDRAVFAHEMGHLIQSCTARQPSTDGNDYDHANWTVDKIYQAIEEAAK